MGFRVITPGPLTTVQDAGRTGYQSQGFPVGGAMDLQAALEFALSGPELVFTDSTFIAVTGGAARPEINGKPVPAGSALRIRKGDRLRVGAMQEGMYGYIAFAGGLDIPVIMGSRSTSLTCGIGGYAGRKLAAGDEIRERAQRIRLPHLRARRLPEA